jgi:hypothetical protein
MKIEAIFTEEANKLLEQQSGKIVNELKEASIDEALQARGEPVEVTASDVKRVISNIYLKKKSIKYSTELILQLYMIIGVIIFVVALVYQPLKEFYAKLSGSDIVILIFALLGLILAVSSYFVREILKRRRLKYPKDTNEENTISKKIQDNKK